MVLDIELFPCQCGWEKTSFLLLFATTTVILVNGLNAYSVNEAYTWPEYNRKFQQFHRIKFDCMSVRKCIHFISHLLFFICTRVCVLFCSSFFSGFFLSQIYLCGYPISLYRPRYYSTIEWNLMNISGLEHLWPTVYWLAKAISSSPTPI